jgi:putative nucleotidyltransferase with HDIG domain
VYFVRDGLPAARKMVERRHGAWFEPRIADAFLAIGDDDPLWSELSADEVDLERIGPGADPVLHADDARIDDVAIAFADVIDAKSEWTAQHSVSVARYAVALGEQFGFRPERLRDLRRMGLLHDIGKLAIPNTVLDKRGRLTDAEFDVIKRHPAHTEEILSRVAMFSPLAAIAAAHHERIDGRGYHRGIEIGTLPLDARILAVADVFDALSSARPYRDRMPTADALAIMRADVGTHLCPMAFAALEHALADGLQPVSRAA